MRTFEKVTFAQFIERILDASLRERPFELDTRDAFSREVNELDTWIRGTSQEIVVGGIYSLEARVSLHNDMLFAFATGFSLGDVHFFVGSADK